MGERHRRRKEKRETDERRTRSDLPVDGHGREENRKEDEVEQRLPQWLYRPLLHGPTNAHAANAAVAPTVTPTTRTSTCASSRGKTIAPETADKPDGQRIRVACPAPAVELPDPSIRGCFPPSDHHAVSTDVPRLPATWPSTQACSSCAENGFVEPPVEAGIA